MARTGSSGSNSPIDDLPLIEGAATGTVAYVVGMILTLFLLTVDQEFEFAGSGFGGLQLVEVSRLDQVGWFFYSAHFASIEESVSALGETQSQTTNILADAATQFPAVVYHLVPMVVLVVAGFVVASVLDTYNPSVGDCAQAGATLFAGYLPLTVAGTVVFEVSVSGAGAGGITIGPDLISSVVLVGFLFPVLFGAIGGVVFSQQ
jgi:hypothetical protein